MTDGCWIMTIGPKESVWVGCDHQHSESAMRFKVISQTPSVTSQVTRADLHLCPETRASTSYT